MKFTKFKITAVLASLILIVLLAASAPPAHAQTDPRRTQLVTASNVLVLQTALSNLTGGQMVTNTIPYDRDATFFPQFFGGSSTNTGPIAFNFLLVYTNGLKSSYTNITATTRAPQGTSIMRDGIQLNRTNFGAANKYVLTSVSNLCDPVSTITLSNAYLQWGP